MIFGLLQAEDLPKEPCYGTYDAVMWYVVVC